jgi:hypothetical protein
LSNNPMGRPKNTVGVRLDGPTRERLTQAAASENIDLPNYLRKHYWELVQQGIIVPEDEIRIPNPGTNPYNPYAQNPYPPPQYPYQPYGYPPAPAPYAVQPTAPDQMDIMFADIRKMWMTKLMAEMMQGKREIEDVYHGMQTGKAGGEKEFSMKDMMQWQMMINMQDRQYQEKMQNAQVALEAARGRGDKAGENQALQLITALATTQAQQGQNNMQQMMAMMQMANNTQQAMYTTSINAATQVSDRQAAERQNFQTQLNTMQQTLTSQQIEAMKSTNTLQLEGLRMQMENVKNIKDPLTQLIELDTLRKNSPILDAAFKGAFGISGGGIGDMIPKLKELGIDKIIDKATQALPAIAAALMGNRGQQPIPPPAPETTTVQIPGPLPTPTPEELKNLQEQHLPTTTEETPVQNPDTVGYTNLVTMPPPEKKVYTPETPTPPQTQNPDTVGYTNLVAMPPPTKKPPEQPATEPIIIQPPPEQTEHIEIQQPEPQTHNPKAFTTGRKKKPEEQ